MPSGQGYQGIQRGVFYKIPRIDRAMAPIGDKTFQIYVITVKAGD